MGQQTTFTGGFSQSVNPNQYQTRGAMIMQLAEQLRPVYGEWFADCRDENGMPVQQAKIRAIALNVAQKLLHEQDKGDGV